ncbi:type VII secretion-associated serine protease mycosin, partial [Mycobacterium timonense]
MSRRAVLMAARTAGVLTAVTALVAVAPLGTAGAVQPPHPDVAAAPPDGPPGPDGPMRKNGACAVGGVLPNSDLAKTPPPLTALQIAQAHKFSTGAGVVVAVIDTGVRPQPRLPGMIPGGDYVDPASGSNGFDDCEGHGTLVAGIIGAAPAPTDGLIGVAPNAQIVAIRQTSMAYMPQNQSSNPDDPNNSRTAGDIRTLARAIVHAANLGATVINLSITACYDAGSPVDLRPLAGALYYAAVVHDAVIVAAAGNTGDQQHQTCQPNPGYDPANPGDPRNWDGVRSVSLPSYFSDLVLSVAGTTLTGDPYVNSMPGPWVGAAAPSMNIVSLDPTEPQPGALTNAALVKGAPIPLNGTSFAAAYVSGLAALMREKYKDLSAHLLINRILATSHTPAQGLTNTLGAGIIDAKAALTADVPRGDIVAPGVPSVAAPAPTPPPAKANT